MDDLKAYRIPFTGLNEGVHQFEFRIDGKFFEEFENEEISDADFKMSVELDKQTSFIEVGLSFDGTLTTECDRCLNELVILMKGNRRLVAKLDGDIDDEDIIILGTQDTELDLVSSFYETIAAAIPLKKAHDEEDCDPAVLEKLDTYSHMDSEETDPRWEALKKLKKD